MKKLFLLILAIGMLFTVSVPTEARRVPYCSDTVIGTGCDPYGHCEELVRRTCGDCDPTCHTWTTYYTRPANS